MPYQIPWDLVRQENSRLRRDIITSGSLQARWKKPAIASQCTFDLTLDQKEAFHRKRIQFLWEKWIQGLYILINASEGDSGE